MPSLDDSVMVAPGGGGVGTRRPTGAESISVENTTLELACDVGERTLLSRVALRSPLEAALGSTTSCKAVLGTSDKVSGACLSNRLTSSPATA